MDWRIALTEPAETDLQQVVAFLARKNPRAAENIGLELVTRIFALGLLPYGGAPVRKRFGLRKVTYRHYLIIYRINAVARIVEIIRIWDGRQNPERLRLPEAPKGPPGPLAYAW